MGSPRWYATVVESCLERPTELGARARLLLGGGRACSDVELLGLVLDGGADTAVGLALAERVLAAARGRGGLERLDQAALGRMSPRRLAAPRAAPEPGR